MYQSVRSTDDFGGKPWYSIVLYPGPDGMNWGEVRLVLRRVGSVQRDCVVVRCLQAAATEPGCVLTRFGCTRLAWAFEQADSDWPLLEVVDAALLVRLEQVHPDFRDVAKRHGMGVMPSQVPQTRGERHCARFFSNTFYAWTSRSLRPGL